MKTCWRNIFIRGHKIKFSFWNKLKFNFLQKFVIFSTIFSCNFTRAWTIYRVAENYKFSSNKSSGFSLTFPRRNSIFHPFFLCAWVYERLNRLVLWTISRARKIFLPSHLLKMKSEREKLSGATITKSRFSMKIFLITWKEKSFDLSCRWVSNLKCFCSWWDFNVGKKGKKKKISFRYFFLSVRDLSQGDRPNPLNAIKGWRWAEDWFRDVLRLIDSRKHKVMTYRKFIRSFTSFSSFFCEKFQQ